MKLLGLGALIILAGIGTFAIALFAVNAGESQSSRFDNYEQLRVSGLIEHGWAPEQLPRSATNLQVELPRFRGRVAV